MQLNEFLEAVNKEKIVYKRRSQKASYLVKTDKDVHKLDIAVVLGLPAFFNLITNNEYQLDIYFDTDIELNNIKRMICVVLEEEFDYLTTV